MADELTVTASLAFSKGQASSSMSVLALTIDVTGTRYNKSVQTIGTSEEALSLGDIGTPGYVIVKNLDRVRSVRRRPPDEILPLDGEHHFFR